MELSAGGVLGRFECRYQPSVQLTHLAVEHELDRIDQCTLAKKNSP